MENCFSSAPLPAYNLAFPPPHPHLQLSAIIPVRNEAKALARTLSALAEQVDAFGNALDPSTYEVLLLVNNSTDETAEIAQCFAQRNSHLALFVAEITLPPALAHVGTARRLLMDEACRRLFHCDRPKGTIASTDGDTQVAPDWVSQTLAEVAQGADAVGGMIRVERQTAEDKNARLYHLRDLHYQRGLAQLESFLDPDPSDPWPRHHQFFGGSLAVTASAYCRIGGLPILPCLEDVALEESLRRMDARVRHSPAVRVSTSARQDGRTALGLAAQLRDWGKMGRKGQAHLVQQPAAVETRLRVRRTLRCSRHSLPDLKKLSGELAVPTAVLQRSLETPDQPFGALWAEVMAYHQDPDGEWARRWPLMEIVHALPDLHRRLSDYKHAQ